jgi:hypothetical protein
MNENKRQTVRNNYARMEDEFARGGCGGHRPAL